MMKTLTKAALAAALSTGLFAASAFAAVTPPPPASTAPFTAKATILKPVTLANVTDLDFGITTMNPSLVSATVAVSSAAGSVAVCSSLQLTCSGGSRADFTLTGGVKGQTIKISYPTAPLVLTHSNGSNTVGFTLDPVTNVVLDNAGAGTFAIGGKITVVAATVAGDYSATVDVNADYL